MDAEIKRRWVQALRSGLYTQGIGRLGNSYTGVVRHCCLGVLCEVMEVPRVTVDGAFLYHNHDTMPPMPVLDKARLSTQDTTALSRLNDKVGRSFEQIADYIEENL